MNRLTLYVARSVLGATLATLLLLGGIWSLFELLNQLGDVGRGTYQAGNAVQYTLLSLAPQLYKLFPLAGLLGTLIGLGMLANHSELTVMRAAGVSTGQIAGMVLKTAILLALLAAVLGEGVAPEAQRRAKELRNRAIKGDEAFLGSRNGLWARDGQDFVHIRQLTPEGRMVTLTRYRFDGQGKLVELTRAEVGDYLSQGEWLLKKVRASRLTDEGVSSTLSAEERWATALTPEKLGVVIVEPEDLSVMGLADYRHYLADNGLASGQYDLAYWRKLFQPIATALMMFVGLSFVFGPMRSVSMGARILVGISAGFAFYLANAMFGPVSLVYGLPPVLGALLPLLLFAGLGVWLLKKAS